ncbi:hypothetical protein JQK15_11570 [Sphingobium sp. BHU LFT2]|uniref:asparagine synthase-related protein n=1 Tax=Sphingobium sp. BHU LFT2 TaxID=2807634 RepID=UPI001BE6B2C5|nr:asparagine synthase-related protein [Sphingobium sp. BHU LFT2]MBT2244174.1 hypothetical protein [Sphingobium sp. BHU LFT2]
MEQSDNSVDVTETGIIRYGNSQVEKFQSDFLRQHVEYDEENGVCHIVIWELGAFSAPSAGVDYDRLISSAEAQAIYVRLDSASRSKVQISRSQTIGAPLYVGVADGYLIATWKFEDIAGSIKNPVPHRDSCKIYIENGPSVIRDQIIDGIKMLWPGEAVSLVDGELVFQLCSSNNIVVPSTIYNGARVTDALQRRIADVMRPALEVAKRPLIELSGGMDSSCVAVAAKSVRSDLYSYALMHKGAVGRQQMERRMELVGLLQVQDHLYPSDQPNQFQALEWDEAGLTPFDDNHRMPCVLAVDEHPAGPIDLILTGIGGDELSSGLNIGRDPWELPGVHCISTLMAATARADMFMRRGIWTLNPLAHEHVVNFCRALPDKLRDNRMINLLMLARAGLSDGFLFPRYVEGYGHGMQREAALIDFDELFSVSIIADYRVYNFSHLLKAAREASNGGLSYELILRLFWLAKLECILKKYVR